MLSRYRHDIQPDSILLISRSALSAKPLFNPLPFPPLSGRCVSAAALERRDPDEIGADVVTVLVVTVAGIDAVSFATSSMLTVDLTVLVGEKPELCMDAIDDVALAFNECSSCVHFCLPARCFLEQGNLPLSSVGMSIARATPRLRPLSTDMSERARTTPPALTVLVVTPELWSGSTLGAVRSAGESTERSSMFAEDRISWRTAGETGPSCADKLMLEVDRPMPKRSWRWGPCVDDGSEPSGIVTVICLSIPLRVWRARSMGQESHSSS
jgi:hypothetical protein